jgi:tight adherence protein C
MLALTTIVIFLFAALIAVVVAMKAEERVSSRAVRARLGDYDASIVRRDEELKQPFARRVLLPAGVAIGDAARRFLPQDYIRQIRHKLVIAGRARDEDLDRFLVARILSVVAIPILWLLVWRATSFKGLDLLATIVLIGLVGILGPDAWLNRTVEERQNKIRDRLPDILDLLTISVEAGLGFEQAVGRTITMVPGPLSEEFSRTLGEMRAGASRADAFMALDRRTEVPELKSFILAILQADTFGVSIGTILRNQSVEMRVKRRQRIQEKAQKAPVKMLFPMVFCIMPALFVVIAGPAVLSIYKIFHH